MSRHEECHGLKLVELPCVSLQFVMPVNILQPLKPFQPVQPVQPLVSFVSILEISLAVSKRFKDRTQLTQLTQLSFTLKVSLKDSCLTGVNCPQLSNLLSFHRFHRYRAQCARGCGEVRAPGSKSHPVKDFVPAEWLQSGVAQDMRTGIAEINGSDSSVTAQAAQAE